MNKCINNKNMLCKRISVNKNHNLIPQKIYAHSITTFFINKTCVNLRKMLILYSNFDFFHQKHNLMQNI